MSSTDNSPAVQKIKKTTWVAIGSIGAVLSAIVPPIVTLVHGAAPNVTASGNGIAVGGNISTINNNNVFNSITNSWIDGVKIILGSTQAPTKPPVSQPASLPQSSQPLTQPTPSTNIPVARIFPKYEDMFLRATGMTSSLGNGGRHTVIPVKIENKTEVELLLGHDSEAVTAISDTGETNADSSCSINGIRSFTLSNLPKPQDPLNYTTIAPGASTTLQIGCFLAIVDPTKVNSINVNIPLVRVESDHVKRFTLNIDGIPVGK